MTERAATVRLQEYRSRLAHSACGAEIKFREGKPRGCIRKSICPLDPGINGVSFPRNYRTIKLVKIVTNGGISAPSRRRRQLGNTDPKRARDISCVISESQFAESIN